MYFPQKNVRYIAITDGIDTSKSGETDIMPFKNILNVMYAKDTSKKVKSAIQSRMKEGTYIGLDYSQVNRHDFEKLLGVSEL